MKSKIKYLFPLIALFGLAALSCKKEEETTEDKFLTGSMAFDMPKYVHKGDVVTLKQSTVYKEDGSTQVGIYWIVSAFNIIDTVRVESDPVEKKGDFKFTVPDTLVNFTVSQVAFASGYYNSSGNNTSAVVDSTLFSNKGSIRGLKETLDDFIFEDPRDHRKYHCIAIGNLEWFRHNINYTGTGAAYLTYNELSAMFGRFYTWEQAQTACPDGWRLPSDEDFANLAKEAGAENPTPGKDFKACAGNLMVDATFNDSKLWEFWPAVKITDKTHFSALPFGYGYRSGTGFSFKDMYSYAFFWTSTSYDELRGVARYIYPSCNDMIWAIFDKTNVVAPVRCVRDKVN